jgi:hypothetical protein
VSCGLIHFGGRHVVPTGCCYHSNRAALAISADCAERPQVAWICEIGGNAPLNNHLLESPIRHSVRDHVLVKLSGSQMGNCFAANRDPAFVKGVVRGRGRAPGALCHMVAANLRARALASVVREIWAAGFMSYNAVSRELNRRNVPTLRGGRQWYPMTAGRLLVRLERTGLICIRRPSEQDSLLRLAFRE